VFSTAFSSGERQRAFDSIGAARFNREGVGVNWLDQ
jgi:hypothetical protein